jgi:general secretion pathway protein G
MGAVAAWTLMHPILPGRDRTPAQAAKAQIDAVRAALNLYHIDNGAFPSEASGLAALMTAPSGLQTWRGPYLRRSGSLTDPWGHALLYKFPGRNGLPDVISLGRDNAPGGSGDDADIISE